MTAQFKDVQWQLYECLVKGEYEQGLELLQRSSVRFERREERHALYLHRLWFLSQLGRKKEAVQICQQAIDEGLWFLPKTFSDPPLERLQDEVAFPALLKVFTERYEEAVKEAKPQRRVLLPQGASAQGAMPLLMVFHGGGQSIGWPEWALAPWKEVTMQGWIVALIQSSQPVGPGTFSWGNEEQALREAQEHVQFLTEQYCVDAARLMLGGFSRGAAIAVAAGVSEAIRCRGWLAVAPAWPHLAEWLSRAEQPMRAQGYVVAGGQDPLYEQVREGYERLRERGVECQLEVHAEMNHDMPSDFGESWRRAVAFLCA